jgi:hypothetical protein
VCSRPVASTTLNFRVGFFMISPSTSYGDRNSQNKTEKKPRYGFVALSQGCQPLHMRPTGRQVLAADTKSAALTR